jgi:2-dehydro-3-deoxy-D-arabinonate dehydratase
VWAQEATTASLRRRIPDLVSWLFREQRFPDGAVLSTGTGLVPAMDVGLAPGDLVAIEIAGVGALVNRVGGRGVSPSRR